MHERQYCNRRGGEEIWMISRKLMGMKFNKLCIKTLRILFNLIYWVRRPYPYAIHFLKQVRNFLPLPFLFLVNE